MEVNKDILNTAHLKIVLVNIFFPLFLFLAFRQIDSALAVAAFIMAIAPTAAAAPVITGFLNKKVSFVTTAVLINSVVVALFIPFSLPKIVSVTNDISVFTVLLPVAILIFVPLILGQWIKQKSRPLFHFFNKGKDLPYYLFILNVFIASAKSSDFIRNDANADLTLIIQIGVMTLLICIFNFGIGHLIGQKRFTLEGSMSLGRKNTMFAIWLALTFVDPMAALAPMFYILYQNIYNSYQLIKMERG